MSGGGQAGGGTAVALLAALDGLTKAMGELTAEVRALRQAGPPLPVGRPAGAPAPVAAAPVPAAPAPGEPAAAPAAAVAPGPSAEGTQAEVRAVLQTVFSLALAGEEDAGFDTFMELMHSANRATPIARKRLKSQEWNGVLRSFGSYLAQATDPSSFEVTRWVPEEPESDEREVKAFLHHDTRMPVPVTLRRDEEAGGALRILMIGL